MIKPDDPRQLAIDLLNRSPCHVQVTAVIADRYGIFSWGWNHTGFDGLGEHAEAACIRRANKGRVGSEAAIYVAARRKKSGNTITAKPCLECQRVIWRVGRVVYRNERGEWVEL